MKMILKRLDFPMGSCAPLLVMWEDPKARKKQIRELKPGETFEVDASQGHLLLGKYEGILEMVSYGEEPTLEPEVKESPKSPPRRRKVVEKAPVIESSEAVG